MRHWKIGDTLITKRRAKLLAAGTSLGGAVVLGLSTLFGGLWAEGLQGFGFILTAGFMVALARVWMTSRRDSGSQQHLTLDSFRLPPPSWRSDDDRDVLETVLRGALLLLAFDRTPSGCWGKSYLYRRFVSRSGLPLTGGSLTGTPLALFAIGSSTTLSAHVLHKWAFESLNVTLAKTLTEDGQYRAGFRIGQIGRVAEYEPLRHAAGGLLTTLLSGPLEPRNLATINALCTSPLGPTAWDHAIVARALLHTSRSPNVPHKLRHRAQVRYVEILQRLVEMAKQAPTGALAWADPYDYGASAANQWVSVWALLPRVVDPLTPDVLQNSLRHTLRALLLAQDAAAPNPDTGLPSRVDSFGKGQGLHTLGTAISALSWNFLAANPDAAANESDLHHEYARKATNRLVRAGDRLLEQPSHFEAQDPLSLEGYFGWAGLLLAVASTGTFLSERDALRILNTASTMDRVAVDSVEEASLVDQYLRCCQEEGLFNERTGEIVARSAGRIALLYRKVTATEGDHAAWPEVQFDGRPEW